MNEGQRRQEGNESAHHALFVYSKTENKLVHVLNYTIYGYIFTHWTEERLNEFHFIEILSHHSTNQGMHLINICQASLNVIYIYI